MDNDDFKSNKHDINHTYIFVRKLSQIKQKSYLCITKENKFY